MPLAVIDLQFDPYLRLGELALRLETIALAVAILLALLVAASLAGRYRDELGLAVRLPSVDVLLLSIAAIPGAVIGGRIGYGLVHADYYAGRPLLLFDASTGGFELGMAVVGGVLTAAVFARALGSPIGAWLHVIAAPLLVALGLGKLAGVLGGTGQGAPWTGLVSTAYLGGGPWGSLDPAGSAWPSQLIEGFVVLIGAAMLVVLIAPEPAGERGPDAPPPLRLFGASPTIPDGRAFFIALWIWASLRLFVAFTWRDGLVLGPLRAGQLISLAIAAGSAFAFVLYANRPSAVALDRALEAARQEAQDRARAEARSDAPATIAAPATPVPAARKPRTSTAPIDDPDLRPVRKRKPKPAGAPGSATGTAGSAGRGRATAADWAPASRPTRTIDDVLAAANREEDGDRAPSDR